MSGAYYNEIDPVAAEWLRRLIAAGHIAPGDVDERSIEDVLPSELVGYTQCHFFAGIGIWSYALRRAGWSDDRPIWSASCPCQPFSAAGKGAGFADERHLWPALDWLIEQRRPGLVVGEQVASPDGLAWIDVVATDLEAKAYRVGRVDTCAAGFGAPHIRQRFYWMADTDRDAAWSAQGTGERAYTDRSQSVAGGRGEAGLVADAESGRPQIGDGTAGARDGAIEPARPSDPRVVADAGSVRCGDGAGPGSDAGATSGDRGREGSGAQRLRPEPGAGRSGFVRLASYSNGRLADAAGARSQGRDEAEQRTDAQRPTTERGGDAGRLADAECQRTGFGGETEPSGDRTDDGIPRQDGASSRLADAAGAGLGVERGRGSDRARDARAHADEHHDGDGPGPTNGFWRDADWLLCRDGRWRPVEPGTFPLAHGITGRVGRLRAYGNGLNAAQAQGFIEAVMGELA